MQGDYGVTTGSDPISFDETDLGTDLGASIEAALEGWDSTLVVGYGERFGNATELGIKR